MQRQEERIFLDVVELDTDTQRAQLDALCAGDPELRQRVEALISIDSSLSADALASCAAPKQLGSYVLQEKLGEGGSAEVYAAEDTKLGRRVALKILSTSAFLDQETAQRFLREARAASALNHPNILTIYETGTVNEQHYIATELVDGVTLREHLAAHRLSFSQKLRIARQLTDAVAVAHAAGIVHRDIKPENVMVRSDGLIKLLDFGLARPVSGAGADDLFITKAGLVTGTVAYMSPEQLRGQHCDARSDVFSLGILLCEMFTDQRPFAGSCNSDVIASIIGQPPTLDGLDARLLPLITATLDKAPDKRPTNAQPIAEALQQLQISTITETVVDASTAAAARPRRRWLTFGLALLTIAAAAAFVALRAPTDGPEYESIAVLPFASLNDDEGERKYLTDGIAENIIGRLARLEGLRVMSLHATARFAGTDVDAVKVGRELDVHAVLVSSLRHRDGEFHVKTELIDARDGSYVWGNRIRCVPADLPTLEEGIAKAVSQSLRSDIEGEALAGIARSDTLDAEAYRLYLRGRYYWSMRSADMLHRAVTSFEAAIARDSNYALAWAGLADAQALMSSYASVPPKESMEKACRASRRAIALDDSLAEAHTSLGLVRKDYDWLFEEAEQKFSRAIALRPSYATAHHLRAENSLVLGRFEEAQRQIESARSLDPYSLIINGVAGWIAYVAGDNDAAIDRLEKTAELDPEFARTWFFLGRAYQMADRTDDAVEALERALTLSDRYPLYLGSLGNVLGRSGDAAAADAVLEELCRRRNDGEYVSPVAIALAQVGRGDEDAAFALLEQARGARDSTLAYLLRDPQLSPLREDPRFRTLCTAVGLP